MTGLSYGCQDSFLKLSYIWPVKIVSIFENYHTYDRALSLNTFALLKILLLRSGRTDGGQSYVRTMWTNRAFYQVNNDCKKKGLMMKEIFWLWTPTRSKFGSFPNGLPVRFPSSRPHYFFTIVRLIQTHSQNSVILPSRQTCLTTCRTHKRKHFLMFKFGELATFTVMPATF